MGFFSSHEKPRAQQPTSTSTPQDPAPQDSAATTTQDAAGFHAAYPHLAPSTTTTTSSSSPENQTPSYDPSLPTTMSCREAFDNAFYCSSFGGHFHDIYRYGTLRACSEHWADWRFCMSLSGTSKEGKANAIRERYREKEARLKKEPNSEDVWKRRGPGEMIGKPFSLADEEITKVGKA